MEWNNLELPLAYYQDDAVYHICGDALKVLPELPSDSIDLLATDPPYGIGFMGKDWDKALPDKRIWQECFRVLKDGSFAFVMSIPRADCLSRMIISLEDAGFMVNFTPIFWAYASGFPKAQNISKAVDKRLGAEREVVGDDPEAKRRNKATTKFSNLYGDINDLPVIPLTAPATPQAKALDGSYGGFQPKPAVEIIIVAMKPLSEKTFVDQALRNRKGITWLDDGRIPYESEVDKDILEAKASKVFSGVKPFGGVNGIGSALKPNNQGRFPANLLVSDDVLNDGRVTKSTGGNQANRTDAIWGNARYSPESKGLGDSGSFSRYFDLDKWAETLPFLIVPKASKSEKNKYLDKGETPFLPSGAFETNGGEKKHTLMRNNHPTVKPLKLMSYLIMLGSREGDIVLDPFGGSGTTALASKQLNRRCIISELKEPYCEIAAKRCSQSVMRLG